MSLHFSPLACCGTVWLRRAVEAQAIVRRVDRPENRERTRRMIEEFSMPRRIKSVSTVFELGLDELPRLPSGVVLWDEVFGTQDPLRVEIGVGNSTFLVEVARNAPRYHYLGFEYCKRRVLKFLKRVHKAELTNIRMLRIDVTHIFEHVFAPGTIDHFYVNHPDPWPKRRHAKKRLVCDTNVRVMERLLRPGGGISLRTDSAAYAQQMLETLDRARRVENLSGHGNFAKGPLESYSTPFERKFRALGKRIFYLEYRKTSESPLRTEEMKSLEPPHLIRGWHIKKGK